VARAPLNATLARAMDALKASPGQALTNRENLVVWRARLFIERRNC
jgi:hypothetical protein